ncbi:anti-sigma factor RsbA family regulatory protein [Streptomyces sp. NPDC021093]|uniref:anti-sigma factor RsbA family regulatory protein n=1 Tax=Streptomyces sp. NPDC021093 TaxID=3365112 RepID=UPI00379B9767
MASRTGFVHQGMRYGSDAEFLAGTVGFVRDGLAAGDAVLAVAAARNISLLREALEPAQAAAVEFVDAADWYGYPARTLGRYHAYCTARSRGGRRRVRVVGEPVWHGRSPLETREWKRYESLLNVAFAHTPHWIVCPYDARELPGEVLDAAGHTHPELVVADGSAAHDERSVAYADPGAFYLRCQTEALAPLGAPDAELAFTADELSALRGAAAGFVRRAGLSAVRSREVACAVHECADNALRHGSGPRALRLWAGREFVVCEVVDGGTGASAAPPGFPGHLPPDPSAPSGHGLWLVRQLSDLVEERIAAEGSAVRLYFAR